MLLATPPEAVSFSAGTRSRLDARSAKDETEDDGCGECDQAGIAEDAKIGSQIQPQHRVREEDVPRPPVTLCRPHAQTSASSNVIAERKPVYWRILNGTL